MSMIAPKAVVLIDGGNARVLARKAGYNYDPDFIEKLAKGCIAQGEIILRYLYYDCSPYNGKIKLPVSGAEKNFNASGAWLDALAQRELFAVRKGILKFRGWKPKNIPISNKQLSDADFEAVFEQKGVDMRIGLDIARYADSKLVDRIVLLSQDTGCVPAMKHARKAGLQVVLVRLPNSRLARELEVHSDFVRGVVWPTP